jgi:hypothetical protein
MQSRAECQKGHTSAVNDTVNNSETTSICRASASDPAFYS